MTPRELGLCQDNAGQWMPYCGNARVLGLRRELIRVSWEGGHKNLARLRGIGEELFESLAAPVMRVGAKDVPIPFSPVMEQYVLPQVSDILTAVERVFKRSR
jgi:hypothetical protein